MHFIIKTGYGDNDFIRIDTSRDGGQDLSDLEKAQYAFLTNAKTVFSNGQACRGQDIISIREDWHSEMGWNPTHKIGDDDWAELRKLGVMKRYTGVLAGVKQKVDYLMGTNQLNLIGKNADVRLPEQPRVLIEGRDNLAKKMSQGLTNTPQGIN